MPVSGLRRGRGKSSAQSTPILQPLDTPVSAPTSSILDVELLISESMSVTPDMGKLTLGRGRGKPRKQLVRPAMEDFPLDASEEEQKC